METGSFHRLQIAKISKNSEKGFALPREICVICVICGYIRPSAFCGFCYTIRARRRELVKSTAMIMATRTKRTAAAAG